MEQILDAPNPRKTNAWNMRDFGFGLQPPLLMELF
jgi:hypothetical protein